MANVATNKVTALTEEAVDHLEFWQYFLQTAKPRLTSSVIDDPPQIMIFVDGAEEGDGQGPLQRDLPRHTKGEG